MPRFRLLPSDSSCRPSEFIAKDAASVLSMVQRLDFKEADVMADGEYSFSIRLGGNGLWHIFLRQFVEEDRVVPLAG